MVRYLYTLFSSQYQVTIGLQGRNQNRVSHVSDFSSVEIGMLAAVHCEEKEGRPFVATIKDIKDDDVTVGWLKGSWKGVWRPWIVKRRKQQQLYTSVIPQNSLILWDFKLTQGGKLRQETVRELKSRYEELDN